MEEDPQFELPEDQIKKIKTREELDEYFTRLYTQNFSHPRCQLSTFNFISTTDS